MEENDELVVDNIIDDLEIKPKKVLKNIFVVVFSNFFNIFAGILVGFIIPMIMDKENYGLFKTFTLYSSYVGLFHLGFIDGIYLKYAGKELKDLDNSKFSLYFKILFIFQFVICIILMIISLVFLPTNYKIIITFVSLNLLISNLTSFFDFITQITSNFKRLAIRNIVRSTLTIISVIILYILYLSIGFSPLFYTYSLIVLSINSFLCLWYIFSYKKLVLSKSYKVKECSKEILDLFKVGIVLLCSNFIAQFILLVDQQIVSILFSEEEFATYSFAYNMISLITVATSAISTVLYPTLSNTTPDTIKTNYSFLNSILLIFASYAMIVYYPLELFVKYVLPSYIDSLDIFKVILPGVLITSSITVLKYNCYKRFNHIKEYLIISTVTLVIALTSYIISYNIFKTMLSISLTSIIVLLIWYIVVEIYFVKRYQCKFLKNFVYLVLSISIFYISLLIHNIFISALVYICAIICCTVILMMKEVKNGFKIILRK